MFDVQLRRWVDPALDRMAVWLSKSGLSANTITLAGAVVGIAAALTIAQGAMIAGFALIVVNRILDGLDGAVARLKGATAWGGYLDSLADYVFYIAVPVGFAWANPVNIWPALLLVASFTLTAVSFLALAAILAGRDMGHARKSFTYTTGLMEGGETIAAFIMMCLFPNHFPLLATAFAGLCIVTVGQRLWLARKMLHP
jgi:phosphatidylglycerophosphate synthase